MTKENTKAAENNTENSDEIEIPRTTEGVPIWNSDEGIIMGLKKSDFLAEVKADDEKARKIAQSEFKLYQAEMDLISANTFESRMKEARKRAARRQKEAEEILHEPSEKQKALNAIEAYKAKIANLEKSLPELSDETSEDGEE